VIAHRLHVVPRLRRFGRLLLPNWLAITIGRDVFSWRALDEPELRQELVHVAQWRRHGWTLAPRYALASWRGWRSGAGWYLGNRFEIEARAAHPSAQDDALAGDDPIA
jgi:hypothetical protein